eukprot:SAG31_NODE_28036_length_416_cov_0.949527_1_plen_67_part_01
MLGGKWHSRQALRGQRCFLNHAFKAVLTDGWNLQQLPPQQCLRWKRTSCHSSTSREGLRHTARERFE